MCIIMHIYLCILTNVCSAQMVVYVFSHHIKSNHILCAQYKWLNALKSMKLCMFHPNQCNQIGYWDKYNSTLKIKLYTYYLDTLDYACIIMVVHVMVIPLSIYRSKMSNHPPYNVDTHCYACYNYTCIIMHI